MNTIHQLAAKYRKMITHVKLADDQIQQVKAQVQQLAASRNKLMQELEHTKLLLDYCVITGESPVQAQLSHTPEQMAHKINNLRLQLRSDDFHYTALGSSMITMSQGVNSSITSSNLSATHVTPHTCTTMSASSLLPSCADEMDIITMHNTGSHP